MCATLLSCQLPSAYPDTEASFTTTFQVDLPALIVVQSGAARFQSVSMSCFTQAGDTVFIKDGRYSLQANMQYRALSVAVPLPDPVEHNVRRVIDPMMIPFFHWRPKSGFNFEEKQWATQHAVQVLLSFARDDPKIVSSILPGQKSVNRKFKKFMRTHFLQRWTINEFAKNHGVSLTSFKGLFQEVFGLPPKVWITEQKLLYALDLLVKTQFSVLDVAIEAGFSGHSYFSQAYKKRFSCSPKYTQKTSKMLLK